MVIKLDLYTIDSKNVSLLAIGDSSSYPNGFTPSNSTIEITPPGYNKVALSFQPNAVNFFRATDLQIDCEGECEVELPDGIWDVRYSITPNSTRFVQKQFIRIEQLSNKYLEAFLLLDLNESGEESNKLKKELRSAKLLMEGSIAASKDCNMDMSFTLYKKADFIIDSILCNKK